MNKMERIFKTLAIAALWYAIFVFVTNQPDPMEWGTFAKVLAVIIGSLIIDSILKD